MCEHLWFGYGSEDVMSYLPIGRLVVRLLAPPVPSCQGIHWTGVLRTYYLNPSPFNTNIGDSNYVLAPWDTH